MICSQTLHTNLSYMCRPSQGFSVTCHCAVVLYFNSCSSLWMQHPQPHGIFMLCSGLLSPSPITPSDRHCHLALRTFLGEVPTGSQSSLRELTLPNATLLLPALELLKEAIDKAGYTDKIVIGMDVAASEFYRDGKYDLDFKSPDDPSRYISADELGDLYQSFVRDYPGELLCLAVGNRHWCCIRNRCIPFMFGGWEER